MEWTGLNELREKFLSFFESKEHMRLPSYPLVPHEDASLLLINSGMAPMKKFFLGLETPPRKRVTTCQKCIRTPDIENVGKTARHGTYFEMLGNFSFGDYFKHEAIAWAWEFITEVLKMPKDRLWITVYQDDDESIEIWNKEQGVPLDRIVRMGKEDNFWEIGSGPCGPCSEIYFDRGEQYSCGKPTCGVGCDCDRYVEFWNLVFSQFDGDGNGNYERLEHPNIDTGMGLERLACIMQGVDNLFEVDTVQNIMKHVARIAGVNYKENEKTDISLRVITDHIRSTTFMVGDGVLPQNEGRGYVLRRLLRRAARHGRLLGITEPFLYKVCETVISENANAYPNLVENKDYIVKVIKVEEERFARTIDQGMQLLNDMIDKLETSDKNFEKVMPGADAFKLYDTYGFPVDLIREIIEERNITLDETEFTRFMEQQRERARKARASMGDLGWEEDVLADIKDKGKFVGYKEVSAKAKVVAIVKDNVRVDQIGDGDFASVVLDVTPFYAESGGQVGDSGSIVTGQNIFSVYDCKKSATGHFVHVGEMGIGVLSVGDEVTASINIERRRDIMRNHTACHLLQAALRSVLGNHVHQAGSMVDDSICRFDFSHFSAMTPQEIAKTEEIVNRMVLSAVPVEVSEMPIAEAKKLGAMALFGEKYGDVVRVCNVKDESIEFCGGTHLDNTSKVGLFKIVKESSVAAGVRRIEAVTGKNVLEYIQENNEILQRTAAILKVGNPNELPDKVSAMVSEHKEMQRQLDEFNAKIAAMQAGNMFENAVDLKGLKFASVGLTGIKPEVLRTMGDQVKSTHPEAVCVLTTINGGKASIMVICGQEAVARGAHAGKIVKAIASLCGGSGGGRPDSAMGGATEIFKIDEAIAQIPSVIQGMIK
ncbi:alanine--tRNA ligase [Youxingia wuxianensis]|uniref:Alanine--tRNA ligase n=1 Tax=Youxingia wuxianensis TaxID=2763678 RepID=A0A926IGA4_9FIRM|nr:alanine--tRNA ligase [Youxingia wuxianensis]MBC8584669.1 alanine--tRNA ligase [Youxingia wuxianensis]